jgi:hypothetical protein
MKSKIIIMEDNLSKNPTNLCPIIVSRNKVVLDGNHRVVASRKIGLKKIRAVIIDADIVEIDIDSLVLGWNPEEQE